MSNFDNGTDENLDNEQLTNQEQGKSLPMSKF
jgi:hypothetical protein